MNEIQPERNPITHEKHRKEVFWQISFPLIVGAVLILGIVVFSIVAAITGGDVSEAADKLLIALIIPILIVSLIVIPILIGVAYGVIRLNHILPPNLYQVQLAFESARDYVRVWADKLVEPVLRIQSTLASLKALKRK